MPNHVIEKPTVLIVGFIGVDTKTVLGVLLV